MKKYSSSIKEIVKTMEKEKKDLEKNKKEKNDIVESSKQYINEVNKKIGNGDYEDISNLVAKSVDTAIEGVRNSISSIINSYKSKKNIPPARNDKYAAQNPSIGGLGTLSKWVGILTLLGSIPTGIAAISELDIVPAIVSVLSFVAGILLFKWGRVSIEKSLRYKKYLREFGNNTVVTVEDLALSAGVDVETVLDDLYYFIKKDYFKEARLVENNSIFILDKSTYEVYKTNYRDINNNIQKRERREKEELEEGKVESTYSIGRSYVTEIAGFLNRLPENIKLDVTRLLSIVKSIFEQLKRDPSKADELSKFMDYYLPTTVSLLNRYVEFNESEVLTDSQKSSMKEIEKTIVTINEAFEKLLNELYGTVAMDINSDISVLTLMLKQEGLLDKDFKGE